MSPSPLIDKIIEILSIPLKISSWRQVVALALMIGSLFFAFTYLVSPPSPIYRGLTIPTDKTTIEYIEDGRKRAGADGIILYKYSASQQELEQFFTSWGNFSAEPISEISQGTEVRQLKLGNCIKMDNQVLDRANGGKLPILICGILRGKKPGSAYTGTRLDGAIAGVYKNFPLKGYEGDYDPAAFWIYQMGLDLENP